VPRGKRSFGGIRKLPSGRYQANYTGPDTRLHKAPSTFDTREDAEAWLTDIRRQISRGEWSAKRTSNKVLTLVSYSELWLEGRTLKPRTRAHYRSLLDQHILPTFGDVPLRAIDSDDIRDWWITMGASRPTLRAHAYGLLRTILAGAVQDRLIDLNPCHIRGAGNSKRVHKIKPASLAELEAIVSAMPERYRAMTLLAAWCALRFGELTELRRKDINQTSAVIHVRRGVVRADGKTIVGTPKSDAGIRDVAIPPHLLPMLKEHIAKHAGAGKDGLLFPAAGGGHLATSTLYRVFYPAREAAGRPDLRWHDLRHSGAVLAAQSGATLADLMGRLGHSTPGAALIYQHMAQGRDAELARRMSGLLKGQES
jgi:integrase